MKKIIYLIMIMSGFCGSAFAGDREVLQQVYQLVLDKHIEKVGLSSVFEPMFTSLSMLDENVKIVLERNGVSVYNKGKLVKVYSRPKNEKNAEEWAKFSDYMLDELKKISPKLQHKDFELVEFILYNGVKNFDKNANYYPVLEIGQKAEKIQGYSAGIRDDGILYIRLGTINGYTAESLSNTLNDNAEVKGIILDLRSNKGGYLKQALDIVDEFLDEGKIVYTEGKKEARRNVYRAHQGVKYKDVPMVVLVDGKTASAAEIVALALKDNERAKLVGAQTYGKGTVQNIYVLGNGAHIALTTERFFSSRGIPVDEVGVRPNICSEVFAETSDISDLIDYPYNFMCQKLSRNSSFDLDVALSVLQGMIDNNKE